MEEKKLMFFTDDDHDDLFLLKDISDSLGHTCQVFHNGDDLMEALKTGEIKPHIIFLDIQMPGKNGLEVIKNIREIVEYKGIPVIIHSSFDNTLSINGCFDQGANYFISKASDFEGLKTSITYAINKDWLNHVPDRNDFVYQYIAK